MALGIKSNVDFNRNELLQARIENRTSNPTTNALGQLYFLSTSGQRRLYYCIDDATPVYALTPRLDLDETVSGQWTFSNGGAPFAVSSTTKVANLNADLLDGYNSASASTANTIALRTAAGRLKAADPSDTDDLVTLSFMEGYVAGRTPKDAVKWSTTGNITLSGLTTQGNGEWTGTLTAGDRILVKDQTAAAENGIYSAGSGSWTRTTDADAWDELVSAYTWIETGATHADQGWLCTVDSGGTLGVTAVTWIKVSSAALSAGNGIVIAGSSVHFAQSASYTTNTIPYATGTGSIGFTSLNATATEKFLMQVSSGPPAWTAISETHIDGLDPTFNTLTLTSPLTMANGGSGANLSSATAGQGLFVAAGPVLTSTSELYKTGSQIGIGTTVPLASAKLTVKEGANNPQLVLNYDASNYTKFHTDQVGGLTITPITYVNLATSSLYVGDVITGDGDYDSSAYGGAAASHIWQTISSDTASQTVAYNLFVEDGVRNPGVKLWLTDAAAGSGNWGLWQTYSSNGRQPFVLGIGAAQMLEINQSTSSQDSMLFGDIPATPASADSTAGPGASQNFLAVCSAAVSEQVSLNISVADGTRNSRARFYLKDAVSGSGAWGLWLGYSAGGTQPFKIGCAGSEWMRLDNSGNMGIGQATPLAKLHVYGDTITEGGTPKYILKENDETDLNWKIQAYTGSLYITRLNDALAEPTSPHFFYINADRSVNAGPMFRVRDTSAVGTTVAQIESTSVNGKLTLNQSGTATVVLNATAASSCYINTTGFLGLGTSSPSWKLDIVGAGIIGGDNRTDVTAKTFRTGNAHYTNAEEPFCTVYSNSTASVNLVVIGGGTGLMNAATDVRFYTAADTVTTTGTERMRIDSAGKVSIGAFAPTWQLDIIGSGMVGADSRTDSVAKNWRLGGAHYSSATEEPMCIAYAYSSSGSNLLILGGGTSAMNAATEIRFNTAAGATTTTGTQRLAIDSSNITASLDIRADDNIKLKLGTGNDLQLWFDGTSANINSTAAGDFFIQTVGDLLFAPGTSTAVVFRSTGQAGFGGVSGPSAHVHIGGGTTSTAALKLEAGSLLTTATAGAMEFASSVLYFTPASTYRRRVALNYSSTLAGDDLTAEFTVTHNLGTEDVVVSVYDASTKEQILTEITIINSSSLKVTFATAPATAEDYDVTVIG